MRVLLESPWPVVSLLLRPERAAVLVDIVAGARRRGAPVYVAHPQVFDRIAGFPVHRGVLAIGRRRPEPDPVSVLSDVRLAGGRLVVVAEGLNDHENLGALFRNAAAFGAGAVLLDPSCCDPLYRRSVRVSVGHVLRVPFARLAPWPTALAGVAEAGFEVVALEPAAPATIDSVRAGRRVAIVVGAEGPGLSAAARPYVSRTARIP
ncbi:MAG TPA: RNA methyltransferase, partial [Acidimicrobiales bacterium]